MKNLKTGAVDLPEISVLMSVYNGAEYIADSIKSILNQTYRDFELLIVNDGSTDDTVNIINDFKDERIKLFDFSKNRGVGAALQFGLNEVRGKYCAKADSDDIQHPERLAKQKAFLDEHPDISLVKTLIEYFPDNPMVAKSQRFNYYRSLIEKEKNSVVSPEQIHEKLFWYCCISHAAVMARADVIKPIGYEDMRICEDYRLFYQMNKLGLKMATIEEVLVKVRLSISSVTASTDSLEFVRVMYRIKKDEINSLFRNCSDVFLWGAGSMGRNVAHVLGEHGYSISGFIDGDEAKQGMKIGEKSVFTPRVLENNPQSKVIVASQPGKFAIASHLENMGYEHLKDYLVYY